MVKHIKTLVYGGNEEPFIECNQNLILVILRVNATNTSQQDVDHIYNQVQNVCYGNKECNFTLSVMSLCQLCTITLEYTCVQGMCFCRKLHFIHILFQIYNMDVQTVQKYTCIINIYETTIDSLYCIIY